MEILLKKMNRRISYLGYVFVGMALNTILAQRLPYYNPEVSLFPAYILLVAGLFIMGLTILKFSDVEQLKILFVDLIYIAIFVVFGVLDLPRGLNFVVGSIGGGFFFYWMIYKQYLFYLE